jgi:archaemetzincin
MRAIHLLGVGAGRGDTPARGGEVSLEMLDDLSAELARIFQVSCHVRKDYLGADFALDPARGQYHSTAILQRMQSLVTEPDTRLLAITEVDLYVPVLTFVFGEAQLEGGCSLVSLRRLRDEYYGLPPNGSVLMNRLAKEAIHELGHTLGLRHCFDWRCVMASSHNVERIDSKGGEFCADCLRKASLADPAPQPGFSGVFTRGAEGMS